MEEKENKIKDTEDLLSEETPTSIEVVGVKFKSAGKTYYFSPEGVRFSINDKVIVRTARGIELGFVSQENKTVFEKEVVSPLCPVLRPASVEDIQRWESNKQLEKNAFETCVKLIAKHKLAMKLIEAEYTFDNSKLLFYFSADGRVDFRDLVKDLASVFHTRIELRQIGIRDEAKMMGGLGVCGRPFCCSTFLSDFAQVSIKMAKEQNLSLNSTKISGACGRLMCCLRFENETYAAELRATPPVDSKVKTPDGVGYVTEISPLTGMCKVALHEKGTDVVRSYHRDKLTILGRRSRDERSVSEGEKAEENTK